jgi:hypothetical protein
MCVCVCVWVGVGGVRVCVLKHTKLWFSYVAIYSMKLSFEVLKEKWISCKVRGTGSSEHECQFQSHICGSHIGVVED